ncbi:hypothetical protein SAMN04488564_11164 [Lentzea waywayandensis]|uniref:Uncharacterized protein n=1 Tax=Lentzea waywayandensis TaxID=84724 RepID=A0A1I6FBU3_9PSEU|nr:hypothetical protein [Lentzea waywayandensis]SFR27465.1 hypothetical protein SAMN04488564_11164 [Lentzea waywayandensis]
MHFPGDSTWQVSSGSGDTFVLYVRDALGISTPTADAIPRLTPPVPRDHDAYVPETFGSAWDRWWTQSLTTGGGGHPPVGVPEQMRADHTRWLPDPTSPEQRALRHHARTDSYTLLKEIVDQLTVELGHEPVFNLRMIVIPVEGQFWKRVGKHTVLVSEALKISRNVIAPLESVLRELAR